MRRFAAVLLILNLSLPCASFAADDATLDGYSPRSSQGDRDWEKKFQDGIVADNGPGALVEWCDLAGRRSTSPALRCLRAQA